MHKKITGKVSYKRSIFHLLKYKHRSESTRKTIQNRQNFTKAKILPFLFACILLDKKSFVIKCLSALTLVA